MDLSALRALHFLHPLWLLALPLAWVAVLWMMTRRRTDGAWPRLVDAHLLGLLRLESGRRDRSPWLLVGLAWTLGALALAGPAWRHERTAAFRAPAAWVLVLDLSPSMEAADVTPNRVTRARYAIDDLLAAARDARVGLVVFGAEPYTVVPLTTDVATIRSLLPPLAPDLLPESGDNLAPALAEAGRLLRAGANQHGQVIVLSDGFADPAAALLAARRLRQKGAAVSAVAVGTSRGAPEPDGSGAFRRDADGRSVLTHLQKDRLQRLAAAGGGRFVAVRDLGDLTAALQARSAPAIGRRERATGVKVATWRNEGVWLLPPLLLLAALLARRGWV